MTVALKIAEHVARLLIVDDERPNRQLLEVMLAPEGYALATAATGEEALAMVAAQPPDLILLDVMMPGMDGYEVARRIKANSLTTNIPVIMVTALHDGPSKLTGLTAGAEDFLTKPVERAELCVRVRNLLRLKSYADYHERYSRTLVDAVSDYAIFMLDADGRVVTWNRGAERLKGYREADIVGKSVSVFYTADDIAKGVPAEQLRLAATTGRSESESWRVRADGTRFWAEVVVTALRDSSGNVIGFAKVTRDFTARNAAAKALREANDELEAFSYSVAHDLRAPLRGMSGFAQVLLDTYGEKLDGEGRDWLEEILLNAKKMSSLIDALLSLGRVTRGEMVVDRVDLSAVVNEALARHLKADPARQVAVQVEPGLVADMDVNLARALLENLVDNAWKFSARTAAATIEFGALEVDGERTFFVRDNGAGFDMAHAGKLFGPFQRLHTMTEFAGTGVGLATAQRIVDRHGGRIWATGAVGAGATFSFTMPAVKRGGST